MRDRSETSLNGVLIDLYKLGISSRSEVPNNRERYNCWSFTASILSLKEELHWMQEHIMEDILESQTETVDVPKVGDIAVFRNEYELLHTAVIYEPNIDAEKIKIIQKPGAACLEITTLEYSRANHGWCYGEVQEYRRLIS